MLVLARWYDMMVFGYQSFSPSLCLSGLASVICVSFVALRGIFILLYGLLHCF